MTLNNTKNIKKGNYTKLKQEVTEGSIKIELT